MGIEIDILWLTVLMFGSLALLLSLGLPLAFVTGGLACVFLFVFGDINTLNIIPSRLFPLMTDYQLTAIPLFIFMASVLERAGVIEALFDMVYKLLGGLRGGLASSTVIAFHFVGGDVRCYRRHRSDNGAYRPAGDAQA